MTDVETNAMGVDPAHLEKVACFLDGPAVLGRELKTPFDVRVILVHGLPIAALAYFRENLSSGLVTAELGLATPKRDSRKRAGSKGSLTKHASARLRELARVLTSATEALGSQREAEECLFRAAIGLGRCRPIDLIRTPPGRALVAAYISRIEYGVYA